MFKAYFTRPIGFRRRSDAIKKADSHGSAALYLEKQHKWYVEMFEWSSNFDGTFKPECEESSVPQ